MNPIRTQNNDKRNSSSQDIEMNVTIGRCYSLANGLWDGAKEFVVVQVVDLQRPRAATLDDDVWDLSRELVTPQLTSMKEGFLSISNEK